MIQSLSNVLLFVTLWTVALQARLSMGDSRQEYWSGLPCPPPGDLPVPGIEPTTKTSVCTTYRQAVCMIYGRRFHRISDKISVISPFIIETIRDLLFICLLKH